ncbi:MAG: hypothetical protein ICV77_04195 [Cyanobacteria bacterium Co-bin8]|nr:hypothetical protein [Cyanobacteria bacterium Co-bin8]
MKKSWRGQERRKSNKAQRPLNSLQADGGTVTKRGQAALKQLFGTLKKALERLSDPQRLLGTETDSRKHELQNPASAGDLIQHSIFEPFSDRKYLSHKHLQIFSFLEILNKSLAQASFEPEGMIANIYKNLKEISELDWSLKETAA